MFLLEKNASSFAAHARTCCEDFCGCSVRNWLPKFRKCLMLLAHKSIRSGSCLLEFLFSMIFVVSCSSLSEVKTVSNLYSFYITDHFVLLLLLQELYITPFHVSHMFSENEQLFHNIANNQLDRFGYSRVSGHQSFPHLATRRSCDDFGARVYLDRKVKKYESLSFT